MSLFLDFPCRVRGEATVISAAWCIVEPICAFVTNENLISFYREEGVCMDHCSICRQVNPTAVAWHPKVKSIASGWQDGHISVWGLNPNGATCIFAKDLKKHHASVCVIAWNPSATRLVSGNVSGSIQIWKADNRGCLALFKELSLCSGATCNVFTPLSMTLTQTDAHFYSASPLLFLGTRGGSLYCTDDLGKNTEIQTLGSRIDHMLFFEMKSRLVILTRALFLVQFQICNDHKIIPVMKMKVAVAGGAVERGIEHVCWVGPGVIAAATGEALIRFWNLVNDETYILPLASPGLGSNSRASSVAFNPLQRYLAVGTQEGNIAMWRFVGKYQDFYKADANVMRNASDWEVMPYSTACGGNSSIDVLSWGPGQGLLAASAPDGSTSLLSETVLHRLLQSDVGLIQLSSDCVRVERQNGTSALLTSHISIRGLAVSERHVVVWNGLEACVYEWSDDMGNDKPKKISKFACTARSMAVRNETIFRASNTMIELCNLQGVVRQKITFSKGEGSPTHLDLNGDYLAVATDTGLLKVFQVTRREPKQLGSPGHFYLWTHALSDDNSKDLSGQDVSNGGHLSGQAIRSIRCNADGTRISIIADHVHGVSVRIREPDSRLHVYDSERDIVDSHDFGQVHHFPVSHYWDPVEPKLLACETHRVGIVTEDRSSHLALPVTERSSVEPLRLQRRVTEECSALVEVTSLFVTAEYGILPQDSFALEPPLEALLGVQVPRLFFTRLNSRSTTAEADTDKGLDNIGLCGRVMRDFVGLDNADPKTHDALLDFSFYLTVGNMDEAHRAVRLIKSPSVWENMAHMCVKTKRLDVAEVCLGHMGHARGAAAVRAAKIKNLEPEAQIASVALQLGLRNDAARLYRECGRLDLLNVLYQAAGEWELALDLASHSDRIHLRSTHHRYAQHLEALGSYDNAARQYELADTYRREIPRMLVNRGEQVALERYVMRAKDAELMKWWAGYCESLGHVDSARHCYESAGDYYSLVRVACFSNETAAAAELISDSRSAAGAYHFARHLEGSGHINEAIEYFAKSGCYNHAIRLARQYQLDADLLQFSIKARPSLQVDCASYFERKGEFEKAVQLYQKGGELARALDICFKVGGTERKQIFEVLSKVSTELDAAASPAVVARCADFFVKHGQHEQAARLYIRSNRFMQAIALCSEHHVTITEDLAEALTPPRGEQNDLPKKSASSRGRTLCGEEERNEVLLELARVCKKQNLYQLACKKFTQAGDRPRALKCLLKSGDTKNVIYYASVSRHRDIYVLAANYLQSLDWQSGSDEANDITKRIVEFYTKARAHEPLAAFYDAYAQMEIDEFRDYEKALAALKQSREQLSKARKIMDREHRIESLDKRISIVTDFVEARSYEKSDTQKMADICTSMLSMPNVDAAIRIGDAYAILVEYHFKAGNAQRAFELVQQMHQRHIVLHPYLEEALLQQICRAVGAQLPFDGKACGRSTETLVREEVGEVESDDNGSN